MNTIRCNECGSKESYTDWSEVKKFTHAGFRWRRVSKNPPKRAKIQQIKCKGCGKIFVPKEINKEATDAK